MVDTIQNITYNYKERRALYEEYQKIELDCENLEKSLDAIDNDEEYELKFMEWSKKLDFKHNAWKKCFAAQFHRCRNKWFTSVVDELPDNEFKSISEKQYYAFLRYACDKDENNWRSYESYCRVGNYLITLIWKNSLRAIKKEIY